MKYLSAKELKQIRIKRLNRAFGDFSDAKTFDELLPDLISNINYVVKTIIKHTEDREDFCQDVLIHCIENKDVIERSYSKNQNVRGWLYVYIKNRFFDQQRHEKVKKKFIDHERSMNKEEVFDVDPAIPGNVKRFEDMMKELTSTERMWITQYIESGLNYEEFARRSNISNSKIKERILFILNKWKRLDIYLPR